MQQIEQNWFRDACYGMFIHWGPFSVAARGEWVQNRESIPQAEYVEKYVKKWKAENYDPDSWVAMAKEFGMKYIVLTTRHHDGFALWDSEINPYNSVRLGPEKDLVAAFAKAVQRSGLRLGFYYSVASWIHPDYPGAFCRDWPQKTDWKSEDSRQRFINYYRGEIRELLTNYGPVDLLWYDGCLPSNLDGGETNREIKKLQPNILINERNGEPFDFHNCEQTIRLADDNRPWEACMTLNDNWGYHAGDISWKSPRQVLRILLETVAGAGNLLLNVGPMADGTVPKETIKILREVGDWLKKNNEFLPASKSPFTWTNWGRITTKGNRIYAHIFNSTGSELCICDIKNRVLNVYYLSTGKSICFRQERPHLVLFDLEPKTTQDIAVTIVIEVEGEPETLTPQLPGSWLPGIPS